MLEHSSITQHKICARSVNITKDIHLMLKMEPRERVAIGYTSIKANENLFFFLTCFSMVIDDFCFWCKWISQLVHTKCTIECAWIFTMLAYKMKSNTDSLVPRYVQLKARPFEYKLRTVTIDNTKSISAAHHFCYNQKMKRKLMAIFEWFEHALEEHESCLVRRIMRLCVWIFLQVVK